jgi:hypothetical protein
MKKIRIIHFLIFLLFSGCMQNCEQNEPVPKTELDKLPPPTQEGKRTFGCLVNGEAWVPKSFTYINAYYQEGVLFIGVGVKSQGMTLSLRDQQDQLGETTYTLTNPPFQNAKFTDSSGEKICWYDAENTLNGTLTITFLDMKKYIIAGTFEFTTVTENCDTIRVTDGRFDLIYAP